MHTRTFCRPPNTLSFAKKRINRRFLHISIPNTHCFSKTIFKGKGLIMNLAAILKKSLCTGLLCFLLLPSVYAARTDIAAVSTGVALSLSGTSACLMEASTGEVIYEQNADERLEPASVTKIMPLLLICEALDEGTLSPEDTVTGSEHAASMGGSQIWLEVGEQMSVSDMLKAMVVVSANDCTVAMAEHLAGSEEAFVARMNKRAEELGMTNVYFDKLEDYRDIESINAFHQYVDSGIVKAEDMMRYLKEISRDNARTPMQWDDSKNAGFTDGTPWINVNPNYKEINAKAAVADPNSVFHYYQELIKLRHTLPIIVYGKFQGLLEDSETIYAYNRLLDGQVLTVACNFIDQEQDCTLFDDLAGEELISNYKEHKAGKLQPYEARVILRK